MNKRIRKKKEKQRRQAWARLRANMNKPGFWQRAKPTGWACSIDGATWAELRGTNTTTQTRC